MKYPDIKVRLTGTDGNAFAILGAVNRALKQGLPPEISTPEVALFMSEATSGDYDHLLQTAMQWVDVE